MAVEERAEAENFDEPVLPGDAPSDYERYLRTEELLRLQKLPEERAHHDELLFQTVHQSSELWLKLAAEEVETAVEALRERDVAAALRLLARVTLCFQYVTTQLDMLERMSPWEYQEIRRVLGHGSGFDSPGWRAIRHVAPALAQEFHAIARERDLDLVAAYTRGREHEDVYALAEALIELDERAQTWRIRHFQVVSRVIGDKVVGTQGTPVEVLGRLIHTRLYPELWEVRNRLTTVAKEQEATEAETDAPGHGR